MGDGVCSARQHLQHILSTLQSLADGQRHFLARFENCDIDPTQYNLSQIITKSSPQQLEQLIQNSYFINGSFTPDIQLSAEQIKAFACVFRLSLLQEILCNLPEEELLSLVDICNLGPHYPEDVQRAVLQQFQELLSGLLPESLTVIFHTVQQAISQGQDIQQVVSNILLLESVKKQPCKGQPPMLHIPFAKILSLQLPTILSLRDVFLQLHQIQLSQFLRLTRYDTYDILEIRQLLSSKEQGWMGLQAILQGEGEDDMEDVEDEKMETFSDIYSLAITGQPPAKTVFKRCLKPNPTVVIQASQKPNLMPNEHLCIVPILYSFDTNRPVPHIQGNMPVVTNVGSNTPFKSLKVTKTSRQLDTLFYLRFELRTTDGNNQSKTLAVVDTKPFEVVSHTSQMKPKVQEPPTVFEIIPSAGTTEGGSRIAIIGKDFDDTSSLVVNFGNAKVVPEFQGPGTLVCFTPRHPAGPVTVTVSNNAKDFGISKGVYMFEEPVREIPLFQAPLLNDNNSPGELDDIFKELADIGFAAHFLD